MNFFKAILATQALMPLILSLFAATGHATPIETVIGGGGSDYGTSRGRSSSPSGTTPATPSKAVDAADCEKLLTADDAVEAALKKWVAEQHQASVPENVNLEALAEELRQDYQSLPPQAALVLGEADRDTTFKISESEAFSEAVGNLNVFFEAMGSSYLERDEVISALKASLLTESAILIVGPGGTGKSAMVDQIGENLVDDGGATSFFQLQLTPDTSIGETMGGMVVDKMLQGENERKWEAGVLGSKFVFLDEFFDGRLKFLRSFLKAFNERKYTQGKMVHKGLTKTFVAATNKYLNEIYERAGNNDPQALIDRFQFIYYAPGVLLDLSSVLDIFDRQGSNTGQISFRDVDTVNGVLKSVTMSRQQRLRYFYIFNSLRKRLREAEVKSKAAYVQALDRGETVQPPYYSTRIFSPRSLVIGGRLLPFYAMERLSKEVGVNGQIIEIGLENSDIEDLARSYLIMQGPSGDRLERLIESETNPADLSQLQTLKIESEALEDTLSELREAEEKWNLIRDGVHEALANGNEEGVLRQVRVYMKDLHKELGTFERTEEVTAEQVTALEAWSEFMREPRIRKLLGL